MKVRGARALIGGFALGIVGTVSVLTALGWGPTAARAHNQAHNQVRFEFEARTGSRARFSRTLFHESIDHVLDHYVEPVEESRVLTRSLKALVASLDPHSHYLTAKERRALIARATDGSAGLSVALRRGDDPDEQWLEVIAVVEGSPAARAGLQPGDHILAVRDREVARLLSQAEADALLGGKVGERIELTVQRRGGAGPRQIDLTLDDDHLDPVTAELLRHDDRSVAHVRIRHFSGGVGEQVKRGLGALRRRAGFRGLAGVVLDLRGNPGGDVDEALVVADLFVEAGVLTRTRGRGGRILREERAHAAGTDSSTPLIVLQDEHSASASELLAVALREHGRAQIVGRRSYGKGTVQEIRGLEDGSVLQLTIARYHSPRDQVIDGVGVRPDVQAPPEEALTVALERLGGGEAWARGF